MKIDRLLAIVTYLLNREVVTGKMLAEKFEVSERTIQRDVDSINMAGIPIVSLRGVNGGYTILDTYRLSKQTAKEKDLKFILMALKSLDSAMDDATISQAIEKVQSLTKGELGPKQVDFSVVKENRAVIQAVNQIESAIEQKRQISFTYTNAKQYQSEKRVEPLLLRFKWYHWYLIAYVSEKDQYRMYKVVRMDKIAITSTEITRVHPNSEDLLDLMRRQDDRQTTIIVS